MVSTVLFSSVNRQETDEVFVALLTIRHPSLTDPIRLASNTQDITSNGNVFIGFPFEFVLFQENEQTPKAGITIQNVDERISNIIRPMVKRPTIEFAIILASAPNTIELDWKGYELVDIQGDAISISATITAIDYSTEPWPSIRATADAFPGLFLR